MTDVTEIETVKISTAMNNQVVYASKTGTLKGLCQGQEIKIDAIIVQENRNPNTGTGKCEKCARKYSQIPVPVTDQTSTSSGKKRVYQVRSMSVPPCKKTTSENTEFPCHCSWCVLRQMNQSTTKNQQITAYNPKYNNNTRCLKKT